MKTTLIPSALTLALVLVGAGPAFSADPAPQPVAAATDKAETVGPSLDELLNLPQTPKPGTDKPAKQPDNPLEGTEVEVPTGEVFEQAVAEMKQAAGRLGGQHDPGLGTQRIQKSVIAKLDQMIDQLRKKQSKSGSGQGQPQQQDTGSAQNPSQQPGAAQQPTGTEPASAAGAPGSPQKPNLNDQPLSEQLSEWGGLPPRLRDQLLQGLEDNFSQLYRDMTERYYRRLAEQSP
ncbi:MAG: hypothetical protein OER86_01035 [Phycisphaerae bacterium]|nr:hypothetical protein [Phycisphaerae bacterium]